MSIKTTAMLLLVAILVPSLAAAAPPSDNQENPMVVDEPLAPSLPAGGADLEYHGNLLSPDGRPLTLSRKSQPAGRLSCAGTGEECGLTTWCCGTLSCSSTIHGGTCSQEHSCTPAGGFCSHVLDACCFPLSCNIYSVCA